MGPRSFRGWVAALAMWIFASSAQAQDENAARGLFERGVEAASSERWEEAIQHFRESFAIVERPATAYNLAVALDHMGRAAEARRALEDYFRIAPADDSRMAEAQTLRTALEGRVVTLALTVSPESASVEVDGAAREGSGAERALALDPGEHTIVVSADGFTPQTITITAVAGAPLERTVTLAASEGASSSAAPSGGLGTLGMTGLILAGVGVAFGVVAIVTGVMSSSIHEDLTLRCGPDGTECPVGSQARIDEGRALAWASTITTIVAGVAAAAGVALLVVDLGSGGSGGSARLEITPGPTAAGLGARLRW